MVSLANQTRRQLDTDSAHHAWTDDLRICHPRWHQSRWTDRAHIRRVNDARRIHIFALFGARSIAAIHKNAVQIHQTAAIQPIGRAQVKLTRYDKYLYIFIA